MIQTTTAEATNGHALLVESDEDNRLIRFRDEDGETVRGYSYESFATVTSALAIDLGRGLAIGAETVAGIQQWADIDRLGRLA